MRRSREFILIGDWRHRVGAIRESPLHDAATSLHRQNPTDEPVDGESA